MSEDIKKDLAELKLANADLEQKNKDLTMVLQKLGRTLGTHITQLFADIQKDRIQTKIDNKIININPFEVINSVLATTKQTLEKMSKQEEIIVEPQPEVFIKKQKPKKEKEMIAPKAPTNIKKGKKVSKWDAYTKVFMYAANEDTPLKRRTLDYLCEKIPYSRGSITRQLYRLGLKLKNGKVTHA